MTLLRVLRQMPFPIELNVGHHPTLRTDPDLVAGGEDGPCLIATSPAREMPRHQTNEELMQLRWYLNVDQMAVDELAPVVIFESEEVIPRVAPFGKIVRRYDEGRLHVSSMDS